MKTSRFTQFLRPDGRRKTVEIDRPDNVAEAAAKIVDAGFRLEIEELQTGVVSMTIAGDDEDVAIELCQNGPEVPAAVDRLILGFDPLAGTSIFDEETANG